MTSNYEQITKDNIRRRGEEFDDIGRFISEQLYPDRSHFIFELLQNAEDALSRRFKNEPQCKLPYSVRFVLFKDKLEFRHFGQPFDENDVKGISDVLKGTKREDITQIGKFGIGFKSVYAFTKSPEIHSGDEHFIIERYIRPTAAQIPSNWRNDEIFFIFPFNHDDLSPDGAHELILKKLKKLGSRVLLFLNRINEIEWSDNSTGEKGQYLKEVKNISEGKRVTVIGQNNDREEVENWLIFARPVKFFYGSKVNVKVGFSLKNRDKENKNYIEKIIKSPLVVYFPTEMETFMGFLIEGPYKTTPARDNIHPEDNWNLTLINETAHLIVDALHNLKEMGLLTVSLLDALPIREPNFAEEIFYPIAVAVQEALKNYDLLSAYDGTFISGRNAKLARGSELLNLLDNNQLLELYHSKDPIKWLSGDITSDRTPDLRNYLIEYLGIEEVRPESFAEILNEDFLKKQDDQWLLDFYSVLINKWKDLWEKPNSILRKKKILRIEDNSHVIPFKEDGTPNAFLPSSESANYPTIKRNIIENETAFEFLKKLGISEPDLFAEIIDFVLPKYLEGNDICLEENIADLKKILKILMEPPRGSLENLKVKIKILVKRAGLNDFIENIFTKNEEIGRKGIPFLLKMFFSTIPIIRSFNGKNIEYKCPKDIYANTPELRLYFQGNANVWFVSDDYPEELLSFFNDLNISQEPKIIKKSVVDGYVVLSNLHSYHRRGLIGFDPEIQVDGLELSINNPTVEKSAFIWNKIAIPYYECIEGEIETSRKKTYEKSKRTTIVSAFGELLRNSSWLPYPNGGFSKPGKIYLNDLPSEFEKDSPRSRSLSLALKMKQPEREQAMDIITEGDETFKQLIEYYKSASDKDREKMLKSIPIEKPPEPAPSFKEGVNKLSRKQQGATSSPEIDVSPISDPERYQEELNKEVEKEVVDHISKPHKILFSPVRNLPSNKEAREFLYEQYQGRCQVTGTTFPKASINERGEAENYFEACSILSYSNAEYLNDAGNMLCVCADTMAKLKYASFEYIDEIEDVIESFNSKETKPDKIYARIQLAGEACVITWTQRHFMRLIALYEKA
jgi:hypothetical protein